MLAAVRHGWRTVRSSKRMLALVGLADLVACLPASLYFLRSVNAEAAHRPDALALARRLDLDFLADLRGRDGAFDGTLTTLCTASFVLFLLVRPLVLGGYVGLAATHRRLHLGQFVRDGGAVYWKYLRLALLGGVAFYLLSIGARPLIRQVEQWASTRSEATAQRYLLVANLVVLGAFAVVATVTEYARIGVRLHRRPGVLVEVGRSALFVLQHPGRTLGLYVLSLALELGAVLGLGILVQMADGGYYTTSAIVLVVLLFVVTLREAARLLHVAGAWQIRTSEAGEEGRAEVEVVPEPPADADVLRAPLPWNVR